MADPKNILISGIETSAASVLCRAVEYDKNKRYQSALVCYQEGIQLLLDVCKSWCQTVTYVCVKSFTNFEFNYLLFNPDINDDHKKREMRLRVTQYIERAEKVKVLLQKEKDGTTA